MSNNHLALQKQLLTEESEQYVAKLSDGLHRANDNLKDMGVYALLSLGGIIATYYIAKLLLKSGKKEKKVKITSETFASSAVAKREDSFISMLFESVKQQLILFVLGMLRQKLMEYLESIDKDGLMDKFASFIQGVTPKPYRKETYKEQI